MEEVTIENWGKTEFECVGFLVYAQSSTSKERGLWPFFFVSPKRRFKRPYYRRSLNSSVPASRIFRLMRLGLHPNNTCSD
jgi:hypothetical protein